jgi:hypothetical protein
MSFPTVPFGELNAWLKLAFGSLGAFLHREHNADGTHGRVRSWTPVDASGAGLVLESYADSCWYVKLGPVVHLCGFVDYPSTADSSNTLIGGLPFVSRLTPINVFGGAVTQTQESTAMSVIVVSGSAQLQIRTPTARVTNATMSGDNIAFMLHYFTDDVPLTED